MPMWKQPIPTNIPELRDNPFAETIFCTILRLASNTDRDFKLDDGTTVSLKRGECLFGRKAWNKKFGLQAGSQKVERELSKSPFLNRWINRRKHAKYSILSVQSYDEWVTIEQVSEQDVNRTQTGREQDLNTNKSVIELELEKSVYISFVEEFNKLTGKKCKPIESVRRQFEARLKEGYSVEDMLKATRNIRADEWHSKSENRHHLTPDFVTNAKKLEKWSQVNFSGGNNAAKRKTIN